MFDGRSPETLVGVIEDCQRQESMTIARRLSAIAGLLWHRTAEAEDSPTNDDPGYAVVTGYARASAEVAAAMNLTPGDAGRLVGHAEVLDTRLPEIAALLAAGRIDWRTTQLVISRTEYVDSEWMPLLDRLLADRIEGWQTWSRRRIINSVDSAIASLDPKGVKERRVTADTARHFTITAQPNGMAQVRGNLPGPAAAVADRRLTELAGAVCHEDPRTLDQRRADAFVAITDGMTLTCQCENLDCPRNAQSNQGAPPPSRFVINVIASQETVEGTSEQPGYLDGYGVIDADQVRDLAAVAALRPLSEPAISDDAALSYQPSAALERYVRSRDLVCRFPGCDRPAWRTDIDHTTPFDHTAPAAGGLTTAANTKCYCRHHHLLKTFLGGPSGWRDVQLPDGTIELTSPTGRVYRTTPDGVDLFPQLRPACTEPKPRRRSRRREQSDRIIKARSQIHVLRPVNAAVRKLNRARAEEIDNRQWRNNMRRNLLILKGGHPSTGPWCSWVNAPHEDEDIGVDWKPPPPPPRTFDDEEPPF